jgi:hypothetical protein
VGQIYCADIHYLVNHKHAWVNGMWVDVTTLYLRADFKKHCVRQLAICSFPSAQPAVPFGGLSHLLHFLSMNLKVQFIELTGKKK